MLIAILACAAAGCWEEVHYAPPPEGTFAKPTNRQPSPLPSSHDATADETTASDSFADEFADDVATQLADVATVEVEAPEPAPLADTPVPAPPLATDPARSPRRMAWLLGSNLSLAALANDRAAPPERVADWYDKAQRLGALLGTTVPELPPRPAPKQADPQANQAIDLLFTQGQSIGRYLAKEFGDDHAALFELAIKSNILLVLYSPDAPVVKSLSAAISQASERANLPAELVQPLLELIDSGAPVKEVRDAVFLFHNQVDRYLGTAKS